MTSEAPKDCYFRVSKSEYGYLVTVRSKYLMQLGSHGYQVTPDTLKISTHCASSEAALACIERLKGGMNLKDSQVSIKGDLYV